MEKSQRERGKRNLINSHVFIDDAFYRHTNHDIFNCFALEWLKKKATEGNEDQTKYLWIAGDLSQVKTYDEHGYSCTKLLIGYKGKVPGIHNAVVCLEAVMRCAKNVFENWETVRKTILHELGQGMVKWDSAGSEMNDKMFRAEYGFHFPGKAIVLKKFENVVYLVDDIKTKILSLTKDKSLARSDFAVLCCDIPDHGMVLDAVQKQFKNINFLTQSAKEFYQDEKQKDKPEGKEKDKKEEKQKDKQEEKPKDKQEEKLKDKQEEKQKDKQEEEQKDKQEEKQKDKQEEKQKDKQEEKQKDKQEEKQKDKQEEEQKDKQEEKRNKIILDFAENIVGLEWPVVFVIRSDLHKSHDLNFTSQDYGARISVSSLSLCISRTAK